METNDFYLNSTDFPNTTENFTLSTDRPFTDIQYPDHLLDAAAVIFVLIAIFGVTGNFITIVALARCPRLRNATTAFVINLAVADLIFGAFSSPLKASTYILEGWSFGDGLLCKMFAFVSYVNSLVSLFSVIGIAINRYIRIVHPTRYANIYRPRHVAMVIATLWISSCLLLSLPFFDIWGRLGYNKKVRGCDIMPLNGKSPQRTIFAIALGIPSVVFIFCYSSIYWKVRKASRKVRIVDTPKTTHSVQQQAPQANMGHVLNNVTKIPKIRRDRKELKVLKMTLVIFLTYVMCYFPFSLVKIFAKEDDVPVLYILGFVLLYLANCMNPIIYVVMSDEYRRAYVDLFTCRVTKK